LTARHVPNLIDGRPHSVAGDLHDVLDPATGETLAQVPMSSADDVDRAVEAGQRAFEAWREVPVPRRARLMFGLQRLLEDSLDELAELVTRENGKHVDEARAELRRGLEVVELAAAMTTLMKGETLEQVATGVDASMHRYPLGVVTAITPFNFPGMIPLWFAPLAVAAGNAMILKPSPRTPLTANRIAELFVEAGIPDGVIGVVHGGEETVGALIDHPAVRAVSFVGSEAVAQAVYRRAGERGKRVQALAGAKNHLVVMPDADLDSAVPAVFASAFSNAGERCLAGSVAVGVGEVADELADRLSGLARDARIASGLDGNADPDATITPVTTAAARDRISDWIARGEGEGARVVVDGRSTRSDEGFFLGPTILDSVTPEMAVAQEEIFGPVLVLERMGDLAEAITTVNRSRFGNAAAIFTRDGGAARRFCREVECGMVGVNVSVPAPVAYFPFAGWRGSFYGDLHATGRDGVEFFTERKVVTSRWP
jgi:malonate-semialdehyde dehydrogenase (acetylating) / methylmalonate-semialdehyde dehydrogenase